MKDSFIFYRSFFEAGMQLNQKDRTKLYDAIFSLGLDGQEIELSGPAKAVYIAIKPQIIANNIRYENGIKGGRKKKNRNETKTKPNNNQSETNGYDFDEPSYDLGYSEKKPNVNDNENDNVNENVNDNVNENENVFGLFETEFKRPLSSSEMKRLADFIESYGEGRVTDALRQAIIYNKKNLNYIERILQNAVIEQYESY